MTDLPRAFKVVRTDRELEMPRVDAGLREACGQLVLLPEGTPEDELAREVADADLLLTCYARIGRPVIAGAGKLKAIIKYGVGIDAIDIDAAREHSIPVVNVPAYAEETVAEGAFALLMALFKRFKPIHQAMQQDGWAWWGWGASGVAWRAWPVPSACACSPTTRTCPSARCRPACSAAIRSTRCCRPAMQCRCTAC